MKKWLVVVLILAFWLVAGLAIWKLKKPAAVISSVVPTPTIFPTITPVTGGSESDSAAPGPWQGTGSESGVINEGEEVVK